MIKLRNFVSRTLWKSWDHNPCHCCGMEYKATKTTDDNTDVGIKVIGEKKHEAGTYHQPGKKKVITHVETKNGPITVITEHVDKTTNTWVKVE